MKKFFKVLSPNPVLKEFLFLILLIIILTATACTIKIVFSIEPVANNSNVSSQEAARLREAYKKYYQNEGEIDLEQSLPSVVPMEDGGN